MDWGVRKLLEKTWLFRARIQNFIKLAIIAFASVRSSVVNTYITAALLNVSHLNIKSVINQSSLLCVVIGNNIRLVILQVIWNIPKRNVMISILIISAEFNKVVSEKVQTKNPFRLLFVSHDFHCTQSIIILNPVISWNDVFLNFEKVHASTKLENNVL